MKRLGLRNFVASRFPKNRQQQLEKDRSVDATESSACDYTDGSSSSVLNEPSILSRFPDPSYFSSNHILVNRERAACNLPQLLRSPYLDGVARERAAYLALQMSLEPLTPRQVKEKCSSSIAAENIVRGSSVRAMHEQCMSELPKHMERILSPRFNEMGMGTAMGKDGNLYMVQYFRYHEEPVR